MKLILRFLLFLIIIFAILLMTIFVWLQSDSGIKIISNFITEYVEKKTDYNYKVKVENITISLPLVHLEKNTFKQFSSFVRPARHGLARKNGTLSPFCLSLRRS